MIFVIALFIGVMLLFRLTNAYKTAIEIAQANPHARKHLGTPIKSGLFILGSFTVTNVDGTASLSIPVSGRLGSGRYNIKGTKTFEGWSYNTIVFKLRKSRELIDMQKV